MLNVDSSANKPEEIQKAERRYPQGKTCAVESRRKDVLRALPGLRADSPFPHHIVFMSLQYLHKMDLFFSRKYLPCTLWSQGRMSRLNSFDMKVISSRECGVYGVYKILPTIAHPHVGTCCIATQIFAEEEVVEFFYGTSVYERMPDALDTGEVYGASGIEATREWFDVPENLPTERVCLNEKSNAVSPVSDTFAWFQFLIDTRSFSD